MPALSSADKVSLSPEARREAIDLFQLPLLRGVFLSRAYPLIPQAIALVLFALIIIYGFVGTPMGEDNFAVVATWRLWWLLLPFSFLLFGRLWCGVCPIGAVNGAAEKAPIPWRTSPGPFLRRYGAWIMGLFFLAFFWVGMVRHICCWPKETAIVLLIFTGGALLAGLVYYKRAWCRYFCPLGTFSGLLSMTGIIALRSQKEVCQKACRSHKRQVLQGEMKRCPLYELPMAVDTNRNCNLCGECVKYCPHDSMRLSLRLPGKDLWQLKRPDAGEAVFILAFLGVAFIEAIQTTRLYPNYMKWALERNVIGSYDAIFSLTLLLVIIAILAAFWLTSRLSRPARGGANPAAWMSMAYAYIPLALAVYLGVALLRLANLGARSVQVAVNELSLSGPVFQLPPPLRGSFFTFDPSVKALQLAILAGGTLASFYLVGKIARRKKKAKAWALASPYMALLLVLSASFWVVFLLPAGIILH